MVLSSAPDSHMKEKVALGVSKFWNRVWLQSRGEKNSDFSINIFTSVTQPYQRPFRDLALSICRFVEPYLVESPRARS